MSSPSSFAGVIYLQKPFILLSGSQTGQGITTPNAKLQVGVIEQVWMGSDWAVGTKVQFLLTGSETLNDGTSDFFMIDESKIYYWEEPAV